jgi:hypothetical protein
MGKSFFIVAAIVFFAVYPSFSSNPDATDEILIQGNYLGKNIIIMNPMKGNDFSVRSVFINEVQAKDEINSCAFEIDMTRFGLNIGDPVNIKIIYSGSAGTPRIFNPEVLKPENTFRFASSGCDKKTQKLIWSVEGSDLAEAFEVEHYRWDKWTTINLVDPGEVRTFPNFSSDFVPHSGKNLFRIRYIDSEGNVYYSDEIKYTSKTREVLIVSDKVKTTIDFSEETLYQLFDINGAMVLDGFGASVNIESLEKGKYYLNYDCKTIEITKK